MPRLLIVGGSTRAAADSVRRAGWLPVCADLFADLDLRQTAEVIPVRQYPFSLAEDVANVQADGWFYCGALENHPEILNRMLATQASYGPLLGTSPDALRLVRNPFWLAEALRSANVGALEVASQSNPPAPDGSWIQKPLASAGGRSIRIWNEAAARVPFLEPHYFQRRAVGIGLSAIFRVENARIEWLGASQELQKSCESRAPSDFAYCGSCGPLKGIPTAPEMSLEARRGNFSPPEIDRARNVVDVQGIRSIPDIGTAVDQRDIQRQLTAIAQTLVSKLAGLRGIIGLDFRLEGNSVWLTEVNPRYTASVEVLELTSGRSFLNPNATAEASASHSNSSMIAKQILYAAASLTAPDLSRHLAVESPWQVPVIADIPVPGTIIERGWPICTVFAEGTDFPMVESVMHERMAMIRDELAGRVG